MQLTQIAGRIVAYGCMIAIAAPIGRLVITKMTPLKPTLARVAFASLVACIGLSLVDFIPGVDSLVLEYRSARWLALVALWIGFSLAHGALIRAEDGTRLRPSIAVLVGLFQVVGIFLVVIVLGALMLCVVALLE